MKNKKKIPRNLIAVSLTSFFMDISSEMVINILPLFLSNILGVQTSLIGVIEGIAESTASLLKLFSGWLSDKLRSRKWIAVVGYGLSALSKPFFYFANTWAAIAAVRWIDRVGKGIRTAPRDALVADSIDEKQRGLAFGVHRAADTAGAILGLIIALSVVWFAQLGAIELGLKTFQLIVVISIIPAFLAVLSLALIARETLNKGDAKLPNIKLRGLGKPFLIFLVIVGLFDLGNSSDAFLILRAQDRGLSVAGILLLLIVFNLVYSGLSMPAGQLSDRLGRKRMIVGGWLVYALVYLGFGLAQKQVHIWVLYILYGGYYGLAYGSAKAMVADLVPKALRGTAYGTYSALMGIIDFPASLIAGLLWQHFSPAAPFYFGAVMALLAVLGILLWRPPPHLQMNPKVNK